MSGGVVHAGPKLLALLELLLDAGPRALTKDEIHKALWPDTFVSEATLTSLVAELRAAIGDSRARRALVRTIHGYGYVFFGEVASGAGFPRRRRPSRRIGSSSGDREIALPGGEHVLGRSPEAAVFVDEAGVSRHHARITIDDRGRDASRTWAARTARR